MQLQKNWQRDGGPSWARSCLMSDVELRSSRSNFATFKISEAFKLHQKSKRARNSEKEGKKRKKERETVLKEISMHTFVGVQRARASKNVKNLSQPADVLKIDLLPNYGPGTSKRYILHTSYFIYFNRIAEKQTNTYRACVPDSS